MTPKPEETMERMAEEEYFDGHACLNGDCPHEKYFECFAVAYKAGWRDSRKHDEAVLALVEALRKIKKIGEETGLPLLVDEIAYFALENYRKAVGGERE